MFDIFSAAGQELSEAMEELAMEIGRSAASSSFMRCRGRGRSMQIELHAFGVGVWNTLLMCSAHRIGNGVLFSFMPI